jgi:hypothetical protein
MIERLADMPPGTVGFRVTGEVEREVFEVVLSPDLYGAREAGSVRTLYVFETLEKIGGVALWAERKLGFDL